MARSPAYPAFNLEEAIGKARTVLREESRNWVPGTSVVRPLGYSSLSGPARRNLAALKAFGLLEERETEGDAGKEYRISDLAYGIIEDDRPESEERVQAIRTAALKPAIHRAMWEKWGASLPSHETITHWLKIGRSEEDGRYKSSAADGLAEEYRETFAYAGLDSGQVQKEDEEEDGEEGEDDTPLFSGKKRTSKDDGGGEKGQSLPMPTGTAMGVRDLTFPVTGGRTVVVRTADLFTAADYRLLKLYIENAGEEAFVIEPPSGSRGGDGDDATE